jgi:hypothetical protein
MQMVKVNLNGTSAGSGLQSDEVQVSMETGT